MWQCDGTVPWYNTTIFTANISQGSKRKFKKIVPFFGSPRPYPVLDLRLFLENWALFIYPLGPPVPLTAPSSPLELLRMVLLAFLMTLSSLTGTFSEDSLLNKSFLPGDPPSLKSPFSKIADSPSWTDIFSSDTGRLFTIQCSTQSICPNNYLVQK